MTCHTNTLNTFFPAHLKQLRQCGCGWTRGSGAGRGGELNFITIKTKKKRRGLHESERADGWKTERNTRMRYSQKIKSVLVGTGVYCKGKWNSCSLSDVFMYLCDHTAVGDVGLTLTVHTVIAPYICPGSSATSHWTLTFTVFILCLVEIAGGGKICHVTIFIPPGSTRVAAVFKMCIFVSIQGKQMFLMIVYIKACETLLWNVR